MTLRQWAIVGLLSVLLVLEVFLAFLVFEKTEEAGYGAGNTKNSATARTGAELVSGPWQNSRPTISLVPSPIPTPALLPAPDNAGRAATALIFDHAAVSASAQKRNATPIPASGGAAEPDIAPTVIAVLPTMESAARNGADHVGEISVTQGVVTRSAGMGIPEVRPEPTVSANPATIPAPLPTARPVPAAAVTLLALPTPAPTATPTRSPAPTPSPSPLPTVTTAPTPTAAPSLTPSPTPMATATPTATLGPTATLRPTATPTPLPAPTQTPYPTNTGVVIECIFYDGEIPRSEADEYVQIKNGGAQAVELGGWKLADLGPQGPEFSFEGSYELGTGEQIRVYTNQVHTRWGGFSFGRKSAVWRNDTNNPDTAGLFDPSGRLVSEKSYPPGCGE